ncbi:MAG: hypothetical protein HY348_11335, partial [Nitrospira defluvii]|nr:hypothetical protein [Nitrospira defluvii]
LNRRTEATYADGTATSFTYDAVGRLTKATDSIVGAIEFLYDNLDRLRKEISAQGTVEYAYDAIGRRTTMTANGATPVSYGYDAASRLIQVAQGSLAVGLGYDNANRRTSLTYPNGTSTSYTYDVASRLTNITHLGPSGILEALTYAYDPAGNRTSLTRNNGTASLLPAVVTSATYDVANEQTAFAGAALQYDANGNLTNDGVNTYQWDARNRLIGMSGGTSASFAYDPLGRRTSKTINGVVSQFAYDGNDIVAEIGGGAVGANYLRSLNIDEPFVRQTSGGNEHYHTDALGSSLALSDTTGGSVATYGYEPFGKTTMTGASSNPFQYTGRENDGTELYYYRARYYAPRSQRLITNDPLDLSELFLIKQSVSQEVGLTGESTVEQEDALLLYSNILSRPGLQHPYLYALNAPINYTDPTGEIVPQLIACAAGAGISIGLDVLSGKKVSLAGAGIGCLTGAIGLRGLAGIPGGVGGRYFRIGYGRFGGQTGVPRVSLGPSPWNKGKWWTHWKLYP